MRQTSWRAPLFFAPVVFVCLTAVPARADIGEVALSNEEMSKLDTFEGHTLAKADQTFNKKQYRQARAEYVSFILEFAKSKVVPYALLRKGRGAQSGSAWALAQCLDSLESADCRRATSLWHRRLAGGTTGGAPLRQDRRTRQRSM